MRYGYPGIQKSSKKADVAMIYKVKDIVDGNFKVEVYKPRKSYVRKNSKNFMHEKFIERTIINELRSYYPEFEVYKTGETSMYNSQYCEVGVADITVKGAPFKICYMEVKTPTGRRQKSQIEAEERCKKAGIGYYLVRGLRESMEAVNNEINGIVPR